MALLKDADLMLIVTSAISGPISLVRRRVEDRPEVVSIDFEPASDKITMSESSAPYTYECSLPEQRLGNPTCARENQILEIIENAESGNVVLDTVLEYDEVVNMEDVTGLSGKEFSDQFEFLPVQKPAPIEPKSIRPNLRKPSKRTANLLDKFGDPKNIPDAETWDTIPGNPQHAIRTRNKEL